MYQVLEFLWGLPSYQPNIEALTEQVSGQLFMTAVLHWRIVFQDGSFERDMNDPKSFSTGGKGYE